MTPIVADISAAPHLPASLRSYSEGNVLAGFMALMCDAESIEVFEENGELFIVSHPVTSV